MTGWTPPASPPRRRNRVGGSASTGSRRGRCGGGWRPGSTATSGCAKRCPGAAPPPSSTSATRPGSRPQWGRFGIPGPTPCCTPRSGTRIQGALPQPGRPDRPSADHASPRGALHARLRRLLPGGLHPRRQVGRGRRGVHVRVGGHARAWSAYGPTTTTGPTTRSTPSGACSAPWSCGPGASGRPTWRTCSTCTASRRRCPASTDVIHCVNGRTGAGNTPTSAPASASALRCT